MKKILIMMIMSLILLSSVKGQSECVSVYGDLNSDGVVTIEDSIILFDYLRGSTTLSIIQMAAADVGYDGVINNTDLLILQMKVSNPLIQLPIMDGSISAALVTTKWGDCNLDNIVNVTDLATMANYLAGNSTWTDQQKITCDLVYNGIVNVQDLFTLANYLAGNIHVLPQVPQ